MDVRIAIMPNVIMMMVTGGWRHLYAETLSSLHERHQLLLRHTHLMERMLVTIIETAVFMMIGRIVTWLFNRHSDEEDEELKSKCSPARCTCTAQAAPECLTLRPVQISQGAGQAEGSLSFCTKGCFKISNNPRWVVGLG